jgi:hypothetical protein
MLCGRRQRVATACKVLCLINYPKTVPRWGLDSKLLLGLCEFSFSFCAFLCFNIESFFGKFLRLSKFLGLFCTLWVALYGPVLMASLCGKKMFSLVLCAYAFL